MYRVKQNDKKRCMEYALGDKVMLKTHILSNKLRRVCKKFAPLYAGPFVIRQVVSQNAYGLYDEETNTEIGTHKTVNLKLYKRAGKRHDGDN
jgi:hypothetical protein